MISYTSTNQELADELHEQLKEKGYEPVIDHLNIHTGERWRKKIAWWLSTCQVAIVLLSRQALRSAWVRYELSVLTNREQRENVFLLIPVWVGVRPTELRPEEDLDPFQLGEIQSYHHLPDGASAEETSKVVRKIAKDVGRFQGIVGAPVHKLVPRAADEVRQASTARVDEVRAGLVRSEAAASPWPGQSADEVQRSFAEVYLATAIGDTYRALQALAQDRALEVENLHALVDLNVMTTFEERDLAHLHDAGSAPSRRSVVSSITRADLADVAAAALPEIHDSLFAYRFVVNGPITGGTALEVAEGMACELRRQIAEKSDPGESAEDFLAGVADLDHPVFAFLARAAGMHGDVLRRLEELFPTVTFVVLSSDGQRPPELVRDLGLDSSHLALDDPDVWASHVKGEREVATERTRQRKAVERLKKAIGT